MEPKLQAVTQAIQAAQLDGVLYATGANFQYLSGCNQFFWQRCCMNNIGGQLSGQNVPNALLFCDAQGNRTVVCIPSLKQEFTPLPVVVSYMDQMEDMLSKVITGKHIGIGYNCGEWMKETLKEVDPGILTVDAEHLMDDVRCVKTAEEIAIMRQLAAFTDEAVMHVVQNLKESMTQYDAEKLLMEYGMAHDMPDFSFPPTVGFKTRNTFTPEENFIFPRASVLQKGTGIAFDVGFMNNGYCSDWGRTVYFGEAPQKIRDGYAALQAGQTAMIKQIIPYKTNVNELYDMILEEVTKHGFADVLRFKDTGMNGHQIGIDCHEFPMLNRQSDYVLKPGMIFCSEPKMMFDYECYMRVEDMVLVTETGAESLTKFERTLIEVH